LEIHLSLVPIDRQQALQFRSEIEVATILPIIQRFDAESISGEQKFLLAYIPNSDCKHATQMSDIVFPEIFIQMDDTLGIRMRYKSMATLYQFFTELFVVIDLPIENNGYCPIFVVDRLTSAIHVDNSQAAHAQTGLIIEEKSIVVRASPGNERAHLPY